MRDSEHLDLGPGPGPGGSNTGESSGGAAAAAPSQPATPAGEVAVLTGDTTVTLLTGAFAGDVGDTHASTDWYIRGPINGSNDADTVWSAFASDSLTHYSPAGITGGVGLKADTTYRAFFVHNATTGGASGVDSVEFTANASNPHEPTGMTTIASFDGTTKDWDANDRVGTWGAAYGDPAQGATGFAGTGSDGSFVRTDGIDWDLWYQSDGNDSVVGQPVRVLDSGDSVILLTTVSSYSGATINFTGDATGGTHAWVGNWFIVDAASNPTGSGKTLRQFWPSGTPAGHNGVISHDVALGGSQPELMYARFNIRFSANWTVNSGNDKVMMWWAANANDNSFYLQRRTNDLVAWRNQTSTGGTDNGVYTSADPYDQYFVDDQWQTVEIEMQMNSATGVSDGYLKIWLDGTLIENYVLLGPGTEHDLTQAAYEWVKSTTTGFFGLKWYYWGGGGSPKAQDEYIDWGGFYLSMKLTP